MIAESRIRRAGRTLPAQPVSQPARRRRLAAIAALGAAAALALAGCSAGQQAQTSVQHPTVGGASANVGDIALRNIQLSAPDAKQKMWPQGSNVPVEMSIVNNNQNDDQLVSVSSDAASAVVIFKDTQSYLNFLGAQANATAGASATTTSAATPTATPTPTATTSAASPSASATPSTADGAPVPASAPITITPNGSVRFGGPGEGPVILLVGLKDTLGGSQTVVLTFTFANAGSTSVITPVDLTSGGYSNAPTVSAIHEEAQPH